MKFAPNSLVLENFHSGYGLIVSDPFPLIIPVILIQYIKLGQNPSFGSRDMVQTSFLVKIWHSKCLSDLENEVKVTKI